MEYFKCNFNGIFSMYYIGYFKIVFLIEYFKMAYFKSIIMPYFKYI